MTKEQIQALVNKGVVTHVGVAKELETMPVAEACKKYVTLAGLAEEIDADVLELDEFITALEEGGRVKLTEDLYVAKGDVKIVKDTELDLAGNTLSSDGSAGYGDTVTISDGNVTIKNGTVKVSPTAKDNSGVIQIGGSANVELDNVTVEGGNCVYVYGTDCNVNIKSGSYKTDWSQAVYVEKNGGKVVIEGGEFAATNSDSKFVLNIKDALRKDETDMRKFIEVKGGKFYGFNPADNAAEGAGTNFVADGYESVEVEPNVWEVRPVVVAPVSKSKKKKSEPAPEPVEEAPVVEAPVVDPVEA